MQRFAKGFALMQGGQIHDVQYYDGPSGGAAFGGNVDVVSGGALLVWLVNVGWTGGADTFTGFTADATPTERQLSGIDLIAALETGISTTETRDVQFTRGGSQDKGMLLISMAPSS